MFQNIHPVACSVEVWKTHMLDLNIKGVHRVNMGEPLSDIKGRWWPSPTPLERITLTESSMICLGAKESFKETTR